jgi:CheY-like chemotaxis protein
MGSKVLLADDSVTIQKVVGIIFANEGYELTVVDNGDAAVRKAAEIKPDVILVDALMPGKNGYEVCREVRQNPAIAHTGILLMTGAFEVVDEEKNRQSGADEFITKPFESQTLIEATSRMIALSAQRASAPAPVAPAMPEQPQAAPVAPPVTVPAAPAPSIDDVWATGFDTEPAAEPVPEPVFDVAPASEAPPVATVKVTSDDDLWGAFDMDAVETPAAAAPSPTPVQAAPDDDVFSFGEVPSAAAPSFGGVSMTAAPAPAEDEFVLEDLATEEPESAPIAVSSGFEPVGEEEISFSDFEPAPTPKAEAAQVPLEEDFSAISFDEEPAAPAVAPTPLPVQPATVMPEPIVSAAPVAPVAPAAPVEPAAPPVPISAPSQEAAPAQAALDENQLRELLSRVSRDVIERIVWEVVPDLAETIIKEEIRKLKAGIA